MKVLLKAVIENGDLDRDYLKDFDGVEVQLLAGSLDIPISMHMKEIERCGVKIYNVHTDFKPGASLNIEDAIIEEYRDRIDYAMDLGNRIAELQGLDFVNIVVHTDISKHNNSYFELVLLHASRAIKELLIQYPKTRIVIENTMIMTNPESIPYLANNTTETRDVLYKMREFVQMPDRFALVIDTCHAELNDKFLDLLQSINPAFKRMERIENLFQNAKEDCVVVHLADCKGFGFEFDQHGVGFKDKPESIERLTKYIRLINTYCPNALIVLEVSEDDYVNRPDTLRTMELMNKYIFNKMPRD